MIERQSIRRPVDAESRAAAATARADAAAECRDLFVNKLTRLERELLVAVAIAHEALSTLQCADAERAGRVAKALLSNYHEYEGNRDYPNLSDLLDTVARCGSMPGECASAAGCRARRMT